jgi:hypothetical protein
MEHEVGIFKSDAGTFIGADATTMLEELAKAAVELVGSIVEPPEMSTPCTRIAKISFFTSPVQDNATYYPNVQLAAEVEKPATGRKPEASSGKWVVQSVIFDSKKFNREQAVQWLADHEGYVSSAIDETEVSFRARQYDPEHFSMFRTKPFEAGVTAVVGRVKSDQEKGASHVDVESAVSIYHGVRAVNRAISQKGLRVVERHDVQKDAVEEHYILGIVLEPTLKADGEISPDTQKDVYTAEEIRKAAHGWMEKQGKVDLMHSWEPLGSGKVSILETYLAPCDLTIGEGSEAVKVAKGTWLLALRVNDDAIWKKIKAGEIGAFSIGGEATRKPLEGEQDVAA